MQLKRIKKFQKNVEMRELSQNAHKPTPLATQVLRSFNDVLLWPKNSPKKPHLNHNFVRNSVKIIENLRNPLCDSNFSKEPFQMPRKIDLAHKLSNAMHENPSKC